jgi:2-amino-4-hydroxy-6-hydroxymethyldihydropteridine diphosphokinase
MTIAYIGLGSNEGDRLAGLARAVDAIAEIPDTHVERVSNAYESEAAYVTEQPNFANAVAQVTTSLDAPALLRYLQEVEDTMGRVRGQENGPRVIDLDILLFGDEEITSPELTVPHPGLAEREFVVVPLLEIAPHLRLPDGSRIHRDRATAGKVLADLGRVADLGVLHNEPILAPDWVPVSVCESGQDVVTGWDAAISLQREVLDDAGIPYAFDPYEPDAAMDPFGMPITFKILVPAEYAERAVSLIAQVTAAEPEFPDEFESDGPNETTSQAAE